MIGHQLDARTLNELAGSGYARRLDMRICTFPPSRRWWWHSDDVHAFAAQLAGSLDRLLTALVGHAATQPPIRPRSAAHRATRPPGGSSPVRPGDHPQESHPTETAKSDDDPHDPATDRTNHEPG